MFDITKFLMRWMFLSNLIRDVFEVQTLPFQPFVVVDSNAASEGPTSSPLQHPSTTMDLQLNENYWRDQCIRRIMSYPPGTQRSLAMDICRMELVQQLGHEWRLADEFLLKTTQPTTTEMKGQVDSYDTVQQRNDIIGDTRLPTDWAVRAAQRLNDQSTIQQDETNVQNLNDASLYPSNHILQPQLGTSKTKEEAYDILPRKTDIDNQFPWGEMADLFVTSSTNPSNSMKDEARKALGTRHETRHYLPQLVSAVLKSPPAFDPDLVNPVEGLRQLLLQRCLTNPSWGIEFCWLLEAEVGRTWKSLFENRIQTGRRLIIVLPADKAVVLAKIGTEKKEAFDLLQDAEQATAYGYPMDMSTNPYQQDPGEFVYPAPYRLPSSLSQRRCIHFGDTMHFIDRLTKISLDLRKLPSYQREGYLHENLHEMNRRIRRKMITRGDVSLDVEDGRSPFEWPLIDDLSVDKFKYSLHFPLFSQRGKWPNGDQSSLAESPTPSLEVARVLNIIVPESRLLSSRERCPFLVHVEVVDTGLEGSDARLYASGMFGIGSTIKEALQMNLVNHGESTTGNGKIVSPPLYNIPPELLAASTSTHFNLPVKVHHLEQEERPFARGGSQDERPDTTGYIFTSPVDFIGDQGNGHVHEQLHAQQVTRHVPDQFTRLERPSVSLGADLLDKVLGVKWDEKCRAIRSLSPYGYLKGWRLASFILKAGEDIRREALVMQVISKFQTWFNEDIPEMHRPLLRPYTIMCVGGDAGLLECLSDAKSIDEIKKKTDSFISLRDYFERAYRRASIMKLHPHTRDEISFETAQDNFLRSLVGYSLVCYVLQIKDRHNANILIDRYGKLIHIDFGFVLGDTPKMGKVPIFSERAPFKLSTEFWEVIGGWNIHEGGLGVQFCRMFEQAFECVSRHTDEIAMLVESTTLAMTSNPRVARITGNGIRSRLRMRGQRGSSSQKLFIMDLVNAALTSWGTSTYDWLQKNMNGYQ